MKIKIKKFQLELLTTTLGSFGSVCFGFFEHKLEEQDCKGLTTFAGKELLMSLAAFIGVHVWRGKKLLGKDPLSLSLACLKVWTISSFDPCKPSRLLLTQLFQAQFTDMAFVVDQYGYWEFAQFLLNRKFRTTGYIYTGHTFFKLCCE